MVKVPTINNLSPNKLIVHSLPPWTNLFCLCKDEKARATKTAALLCVALGGGGGVEFLVGVSAIRFSKS